MNEHRTPRFQFAAFQPAEVERITGLSTTLIRDWRRRKIIHAKLDKGPDGFALHSVAELLILRLLSDHGIGPKRVYGWTSGMATRVVYHALASQSAWEDDEAWGAWQDDQANRKSTNTEQYATIFTAPHGIIMTDDLRPAFGGVGRSVGTAIDLAALGRDLLQLAEKPIARLAGYIVLSEVAG